MSSMEKQNENETNSSSVPRSLVLTFFFHNPQVLHPYLVLMYVYFLTFTLHHSL